MASEITEISSASSMDEIRGALSGVWGMTDCGTHATLSLGRLGAVFAFSDCTVSLPSHRPFWHGGKLVGTGINRVKLGKGDNIFYIRS